MEEENKIYLWKNLWVALLFLFLMWSVFLIEFYWEIPLKQYGLRPREWEGLIGIVTSPFLHGDWNHLISNSAPMFILTWATFYFYRPVAWSILTWSFILTGAWVWIAARTHSNHIGASGLIYALAAFVFFSGIFRKKGNLIALSLLVVFLYGGMVWGVLPFDQRISFESHLLGAIAGFILAWSYRTDGPQRKRYSWEDEEEDEDEYPYWMEGTASGPLPQRQIRIQYIYKPAEPEQEKKKDSESENPGKGD